MICVFSQKIYLFIFVLLVLYVVLFCLSLSHPVAYWLMSPAPATKKQQGMSRSRRTYKSRLNFTWLDDNPVYKKFYIKESKIKKEVTVLLIVSTAPKRHDRRAAIRQTWWTQCIQTNHVKPECIFMTDYQGPKEKHFDAVQEEKIKYDDIHFQHVESGVTFGERFLNHMVFALRNYDFDYFLRVDDDQFVCLEQLLKEVPTPMLTHFHWGWVHMPANIRRAEESMIMFSRDVIETFVMQDPHKIMCHPWADQMIAVWLTELSIRNIYRHDDRIHHLPTLSQVPFLRNIKNLCHSFMTIHGTYVNDMALLWEHRGSAKNTTGNLFTNSRACPITTPFEWRGFDYTWKYEPKLCNIRHKWDTRKQMGKSASYGGREDT